MKHVDTQPEVWKITQGDAGNYHEVHMTLQTVGALCVAVAIVGGGLKINEVEIPRLSPRRVVALGFAGILFLGAGVLVDHLASRPAVAAPPSTVQTR
ncbi:hypothetical protein [Streptomyces carpaticus]|uniref:hypothetical protein n=1 Tax=Streptomyces carpaticus TaxID=285558 RepID=UPI0031F9B0EF